MLSLVESPRVNGVMKLLIIEDSQRLLRSLSHGLKKHGFSVDMASDGREGLDFALFNDYDVIILDLMLPSVDGLTILRKLRASGKQTHVLILSARDQVDDRVRGLHLGADDYMIKPFSFEELIARINTLVRRKYEAKSPEISISGITLNTATKEVTADGQSITLTPGRIRHSGTPGHEQRACTFQGPTIGRRSRQ